jgi:hypothetical protein
MRILLINQNWFAPELRALGHDVLTCGMRPHLEYQIRQAIIRIDDLLTQLPGGFTPDRIVWLDVLSRYPSPLLAPRRIRLRV